MRGSLRLLSVLHKQVQRICCFRCCPHLVYLFIKPGLHWKIVCFILKYEEDIFAKRVHKTLTQLLMFLVAVLAI